MNKRKDLKKLFNMNNILNQVVAFGAYLILIGSVLVLVYLSFIEKFNFTLDIKTLGIFSAAVVFLSFTNWNLFYHKQYEKIMAEDIQQYSENKYSIHCRYYFAVKDWNDEDLQAKIDEFNKDFEQNWLRDVESTTGYTIAEITNLPYRKFKYKRLMWKIKNHKYPKSGYKTSMELKSLFSFQNSNFNKRNLKADKHFYRINSVKKLIVSLLSITIGASLIPDLIDGEAYTALLKLILAIGSLLSASFSGAMSGIKGARIKLSIVEDACRDLESWKGISPYLAPFINTEKSEKIPVIDNEEKDKPAEITDSNEIRKPITFEIFNNKK